MTRITKGSPRWRLDMTVHLRAAGLLEPVEEYRFAPPRRWRFDLAWPPQKIALEVEGGVFSGGRHTRGIGFIADAEKYNEAAVRGWTVLRYTPTQMLAGAYLGALERLRDRGRL